ncbi:pseudouridylate synthase RPUSD2 [Nematostella vectensis]|uniref:pseudouridylate synthase RPUSD2 n=1 Tax=Nematostella vectensis TaxID=45351 RepID=UPI002077736B|nr:pseudouridylate synthase RPUSD2 [Nematostella vectensis]
MEEASGDVHRETGKKRKLSKEERKIAAKEKKAKMTERKRPPGFNKELHEETSYFSINGLRHVKPYYFTFTSHCKGRWLNRELLDIFREEFRSESISYYEKAIESGKITVNGEKVLPTTVLRGNDVLRNRVHRHEPPVTDQPLEIICNTDDIVVLNKPSSIPVHPCGRYRHNTVVFLLGKEHNLRNLYTIHRIDRLTSGILMFAKTLTRARMLEAQVRDRQVEKEYLCRVQGEFPSEPVDCEQPIIVVSHKVGICRVSPDGKSCRTVFTKLHSNGKSSVVKCIPYTGRMHQIRVHLQWLGYPIIDDPIYNHPAWGTKRGRGGVTDDQALEVIKALAQSTTIIEGDDVGYTPRDREAETRPIPTRPPGENFPTCNIMTSSENSTTLEHSTERDMISDGSESPPSNISDNSKNINTGMSLAQAHAPSGLTAEQSAHGLTPVPNECRDDKANMETGAQRDEMSPQGEGERDADCSECRIWRRDPTPQELTMCLHALSYKGPDWEYCTSVPSWAEKNWGE